MVDDFSACLPHYTSGQTYYYPAFNAARAEDAIKFAREFGDVMAMPIMVDAITRVRASRGVLSFQYTSIPTKVFVGLRLTSFHGNFFVRSADLLAMPTVAQNQSYAIEVEIEETITAPYVVFQTGILHTTCYGRASLIEHML
jgi:protein transport protein SEC24